MPDMSKEQAARILDPETSLEALKAYAGDCEARLAAIQEACRMGADALQGHIDLDAWKGCACNDLEKACRTCISLRCHFCIKGSEYKRGNYCSTCGRPLTERARYILEKRLRGCVE